MNVLLKALRQLGNQGARGVAVAMFIATVLPDLAVVFRPWLGEAVFALLTIAFARLQPAALQSHLRKPALPVLACVWTIIAIPLFIGALSQWLSFDEWAPQIYLALMLQAIASPMTATPAITLLLGLDATIVLIVMVTSTALVPLSAALFSHLFLGGELPIAPGTLSWRLFVLLAGSAVLGTLLRHGLGVRRIAQRGREFDGMNIVLLFIFAAAIMGSVIPNLLARPLFVLALTALVFVVFFALQLLSTLLFLRAGRGTAIALGFMCSQRNMGMMLAATAGAVSEQVWLYCALAQLPIYLGPMLLTPIVHRLVHRHADGTVSASAGDAQ